MAAWLFNIHVLACLAGPYCSKCMPVIGSRYGDGINVRAFQQAADILKGEHLLPASLGRGQFAIAAEIDLHGLGRHAAHEALREFITEAAASGLGCVRVIHGKGRGSGQRGPILKHVVNHWLRRMDDVIAFASARPADGGTGAACVLLAPGWMRRRCGSAVRRASGDTCTTRCTFRNWPRSRSAGTAATWCTPAG